MFFPARVTVLAETSTVRSAAVKMLERLPVYLRLIARTTASSSGKLKGFTR